MALPLTVFKTIPADAPAVATQIYRAPVGYNAIILTAQAVNTNFALPFTFSMSIQGTRDGTPFNQFVIAYYSIPSREVLIASGGTAGKLVLQTGDSLWIAGESTELKFTLSVLETLV